MKNLLISFLTVVLFCLTTSAVPVGYNVENDNRALLSHVPKTNKVVVNSYVINVGRGATFFGISKKLSEVSGKKWSWDLVDKVQQSHQQKYYGEVLKPQQKFSVSL
ncbi:hypothetical protein [Flammeovirga sp. SubArs3]|uniref:hypothetical protein n=1 Tax=Flammeovirga sp. SubArs3 TaxID=2995316 RepID=UPI00248C4087|nr:hypothetical protein [Flammeovirga sp. SubArs3]